VVVQWSEDPPTLLMLRLLREPGQPTPTDVVERMPTAEELGRGLFVRRQMVFAALSLAYYDHDPRDVDTNRTLAGLETRLTPYAHVEGTFEEASFGHLSGYSSNYYTYMWSLVIAKDLFTPFQAAGLLDRGMAMKYRRAVLEAGGTRPAAEMVRDFLGRPFSFKAYEAWLDHHGS
jgi:thimet oligopeptidase